VYLLGMASGRRFFTPVGLVLHTKPTKLHLMQDAIQCANPKFEIKIHNSSAL